MREDPDDRSARSLARPSVPSFRPNIWERRRSTGSVARWHDWPIRATRSGDRVCRVRGAPVLARLDPERGNGARGKERDREHGERQQQTENQPRVRAYVRERRGRRGRASLSRARGGAPALRATSCVSVCTRPQRESRYRRVASRHAAPRAAWSRRRRVYVRPRNGVSRVCRPLLGRGAHAPRAVKRTRERERHCDAFKRTCERVSGGHVAILVRARSLLYLPRA